MTSKYDREQRKVIRNGERVTITCDRARTGVLTGTDHAGNSFLMHKSEVDKSKAPHGVPIEVEITDDITRASHALTGTYEVKFVRVAPVERFSGLKAKPLVRPQPPHSSIPSSGQLVPA